MTKKSFFLSTIGISALLFILYNVFSAYYISKQQNTRLAELLPTPVVSTDEDTLFYALIGQEVNMNNGVTMGVVTSMQPMSEPPQPLNHFTYVVFNNTSEAIRFPDQGFGLEIYTIENSAWKLLQLRYVPIASEKELPPKLKKLDFDAENFLSLSEENLNSLPSHNIRLYIHGVGEKTNKRYGAYLDISLP